MAKSYRLITKVDSQTKDQELRVNIDQDFDFLEILSLKLTQSDIYRRFCSDYGVIAGRVVANGGYGIPNARVSVFVPIEVADVNNPIISSLYPYTTLFDKNEDGFRYNLLPYEPSYEGHRATGTFPSREDILNRKEVLEIYEKYYKYTVKTNESGDYMIVGVPIGNQQIVVDVDLSDMGCFSLRPSDLIRMGRATKEQFDGNDFRTSTDIASLPQIVNFTQNVNVSSFWGQASECTIGITRVDFDLRDRNINIEPTALFMGSVFSSSDEDYLKNNCKPKSEQGDLCGLVTNPGTLLAIRQTVNLDTEGRPILEQYALPSGGKVIDENGAFVVDVPMNLDYLTTDEYGNLVISQNPKVGIPSNAKYRFKVKFDSEAKDIASLRKDSPIINQNFLNLDAFTPKGSVLRANYLVPNIKEYGWKNSEDPATKADEYKNSPTINLEFTNNAVEQELSFFADSNASYRVQTMSGATALKIEINNVVDNSKWIDAPQGGTVKITAIKETEVVNLGGVDVDRPVKAKVILKKFNYDYSLFQRSYSFSLDWDDYVSYDDAVNCRDVFYEFTYNKVYTVSQLIDEYRKGTNRSRFLGIKEILQRNCQTEVNKFPVNDGVRNFDLIYFIINILFTILTIPLALIIVIYSLIKFLWNNFAVVLAIFFLAYCAYRVGSSVFVIAGLINLGGPVIGAILRETGEALVWGVLFTLIISRFKSITALVLGPLRLPMLTYPDCSSCDCGAYEVADGPPPGEVNTSLLADINTPSIYLPKKSNDSLTDALINQGYGQVVAGRDDKDDNLSQSESRTPRFIFRNNEYWDSDVVITDNGLQERPGYSLPLPERVNLYNTKGHYYDSSVSSGGGSNRIKVYPNYMDNGGATSLTNAGFYEDQPLVILCDANFLSNFSAGTMLSFVQVSRSNDPNISASTKTQNSQGTNNVTGTTPSVNTNYNVTIKYADPTSSRNINITKNFVVKQEIYTGSTYYNFPADIEYYQVVTGYTLSDIDKITSSGGFSNSLYNYSFLRRVIRGKMNVGWGFRDDNDDEVINYSYWDGYREPLSVVPKETRNNLVLAILMKGVDPYSPRQKTKIDISRILGYDYGKLICENNYKLNIPIQQINTVYSTGQSLGIDDYSRYPNNSQTQIFHPSYFFTASTITTLSDTSWKYSAFTTSNHTLYSSFDNSPSQRNGVTDVNNQFINGSSDAYFSGEFVEGGSYMKRTSKDLKVAKKSNGNGGEDRDVGVSTYYRTIYNSEITLNMTNNLKVVMRTDRLPRSDSFDNNFVLAQNKRFGIYPINENGYANQVLVGITNNGDFSNDDAADFEESYGSSTTSVLSTFNCENMVPIGAYDQTDNEKMALKPETDDVYWITDKQENKRVVNGCYQFCVENLTFKADLNNFGEWKSRFMIGLAICRNVFGMSFTNQWINGALYMPGFQNEKIYRNISVKDPEYKYCTDKIVFRIENNSFFYRSSPYEGGFYGMPAGENEREKGNKNYLGNPTTIMDLGPKDNIIKNICAQPEFQGYFAGRLTPTSFNSLGDLLQLFVVSRLSNRNFLNAIVQAGNLSVGQFFSRRGQKIDGDFAQLSSINSEFGVVPFTPEVYKDNSLYFNDSLSPTVGVFFTGNTEDRDYVTPGRDIFIDTPTKLGFNQFGRKSQVVPMYKWRLELPTDGSPSIFGSEKNDWYTGDVARTLLPSYEYQGIDRLNNSTYFQSNRTKPSVQRPGYIYSSTASLSPSGQITGFTYDPTFTKFDNNDTFLVGAPFHFYFGLKVGRTALDKFIRDYAIEI